MTEDEQIECMARAHWESDPYADEKSDWEHVPQEIKDSTLYPMARAAHRALMEKVRADAGELVKDAQKYGEQGKLTPFEKELSDALALLAQPFPREHIEALLDSHARLFKFVVKHNELFDDIEDDWTDAIAGAAADEPIRAMLRGRHEQYI